MYSFNCVIQFVERKMGGLLPKNSLLFALPYSPGPAV